jgi:tetratricopeptide (TPR) repeat protein
VAIYAENTLIVTLEAKSVEILKLMSVQKTIKLASFTYRLLLLLPAVFALLAFIFVFKWCVADSAATRANNIEIAQLTTAWAPDDPQTHYTLALLREKSFLPEDLDSSVTSYQTAAALSPFDYRYWLPFAQARERGGDAAGAEKTMRRALELAPNYAQIHWAMGNILLREDRTGEAFSEMRLALEKNPAFAATAAMTALQFSNEAPAALLEKLGNSSDVKAAMAMALARQNRFDEGASIWNSIPQDEQKNRFSDKRKELIDILIAAKKYRYAGQITQNTPARITNPGFEEELDISNTSPFDWKIAEGAQPKIGFDEQQKAEGKRSLGIFFARASGRDFRPVAQTVAVDSNSSYRLNISFRSEIVSTGSLRWEIVDAGSGEALGATKDLSNTNDQWQGLETNFKTAAQTEAVTIRLVRTGCQSCSIEGKLWFDNFALSPL